MSLEDERASAVRFVAIFSAGIALFCTITNMAIILKMRKWTLNVKLVYVLCWSQFLYDITFYGGVEKSSFHNVKGTSSLFAICTFFQVWLGTSSSLITNLMTTIIYYILRTRKNVEKTLSGSKFHFVWLLFIPGFIMGFFVIAPILQVQDGEEKQMDTEATTAYTLFRIASIVYNIIVFLLTVRLVHRIVGDKPKDKRNNYENALSLIVDRSKYFWVVQFICRAGASVWELRYGYGGYNGEGGPERFTSAFFFALLTPSASVGYLIIFILCQPSARSSLRELLIVDIPYIASCCNMSPEQVDKLRERRRDIDDMVRDSDYRNSVIDDRDSEYIAQRDTIEDATDYTAPVSDKSSYNKWRSTYSSAQRHTPQSLGLDLDGYEDDALFDIMTAHPEEDIDGILQRSERRGGITADTFSTDDDTGVGNEEGIGRRYSRRRTNTQNRSSQRSSSALGTRTGAEMVGVGLPRVSSKTDMNATHNPLSPTLPMLPMRSGGETADEYRQRLSGIRERGKTEASEASANVSMRAVRGGEGNDNV